MGVREPLNRAETLAHTIMLYILGQDTFGDLLDNDADLWDEAIRELAAELERIGKEGIEPGSSLWPFGEDLQQKGGKFGGIICIREE